MMTSAATENRLLSLTLQPCSAQLIDRADVSKALSGQQKARDKHRRTPASRPDESLKKEKERRALIKFKYSNCSWKNSGKLREILVKDSTEKNPTHGVGKAPANLPSSSAASNPEGFPLHELRGKSLQTCF